LDTSLFKDSTWKTFFLWMVSVAFIYYLFSGSSHVVQEDTKPTQPNTLHHMAKKAASGNRALHHPVLRDRAPNNLHDFNYARLKTKVKEELFHSIIMEACDKYNVDPALIKAIIMAESSYNPMAVSKKGARGLMQLMPATASALGVEDPFDPAHNINGGIQHLKTLMKQFKGDLKLTLAAYHAGSKNVREYRGIPPFRTTQYYVKNVLKYYQKYQEEQKWNERNRV
jgi:soluble lytic murein transglycosylase-like protein